jgi:hypothetical protein
LCTVNFFVVEKVCVSRVFVLLINNNRKKSK